VVSELESQAVHVGFEANQITLCRIILDYTFPTQLTPVISSSTFNCPNITGVE
jgi:hypothetical protein